MSSEQSQEDKQFDHFKVNFYQCITGVLQLFVDNLHTIEYKNLEKEMSEVWGSSVVHRWFMDSQRSIIHAGDISKMNFATCYTILQYACNLEPPDTEAWTDTDISLNHLEVLITRTLCQLIDVVYSKDYIDNIQQNELWAKLLETLYIMNAFVFFELHNKSDFRCNLENLLGSWSEKLENCSDKKEMNEEIDLSECMKTLDFIVRREIFEEFKKGNSSFLHFCPNKMFSRFKMSHLDSDQLISYTDIFDWKDKDYQFPQVYIICGQRAAGKSFYMKYVYQQFGSDPSSFIGIDKFELIMFIESSNNSAHCLVDEIHSSLQNATQKLNLHASEIQEIMLRGKLLVMMDSFDVATPETHQLLKEITNFSTNNITLMIATRSDCLDNLCDKIPKTKKTVILYPETNVSTYITNEGQGEMVEMEGATATASCTFSLEIPPGYEASTVSHSKVFIDENTLKNELSKLETVSINDENPRDKKKPSAGTVRNASSKLKILIEQLHTATAELSKYESDEGRCQLQGILDEFEELHKEADLLNRKLPPGMRTKLYKSGESIFWGITYWFERLCGETKISIKMLDEMESNYSKVKNHLHPEPEANIAADREMPNFELVMANQNTLCELLEQAKEAVTMIKKNEGRTDLETKKMLLELVIDIRNLRERCDSFNTSLPKIVMLRALLNKKEIGLFAGLDYFYYVEQLGRYEICKSTIQQLDEADNEIRNHLLNPEPMKAKLVKSWKPEEITTNVKKNKVKKTKAKKKCKTGW